MFKLKRPSIDDEYKSNPEELAKIRAIISNIDNDDELKRIINATAKTMRVNHHLDKMLNAAKSMLCSEFGIDMDDIESLVGNEQANTFLNHACRIYQDHLDPYQSMRQEMSEAAKIALYNMAFNVHMALHEAIQEGTFDEKKLPESLIERYEIFNDWIGMTKPRQAQIIPVAIYLANDFPVVNEIVQRRFEELREEVKKNDV